MSMVIALDSPTTRAYMAHAALLAVKLLALSPMAAMTWVRKGLFRNVDVVRRAYLTELKIVSPFWVLSALYITTEPAQDVAITLLRLYSFARLVILLGYVSSPAPAPLTDMALVVSYVITCFMALWVVYYYRKSF